MLWNNSLCSNIFSFLPSLGIKPLSFILHLSLLYCCFSRKKVIRQEVKIFPENMIVMKEPTPFSLAVLGMEPRAGML
jgi:hypothetical protein